MVKYVTRNCELLLMTGFLFETGEAFFHPMEMAWSWRLEPWTLSIERRRSERRCDFHLRVLARAKMAKLC